MMLILPDSSSCMQCLIRGPSQKFPVSTLDINIFYIYTSVKHKFFILTHTSLVRTWRHCNLWRHRILNRNDSLASTQTASGHLSWHAFCDPHRCKIGPIMISHRFKSEIHINLIFQVFHKNSCHGTPLLQIQLKTGKFVIQLTKLIFCCLC